MLKDIGEIPLTEANEEHIPVHCLLAKSDIDKRWVWGAADFRLGIGLVVHGAYMLEADTREEIIEYVNKYVVPLYEAALYNLKTFGENYYWKRKKE